MFDMNNDILNAADIKLLVDSFYAKVRGDELLSEIFNGKIGESRKQHLEKMYGFWSTVLFAEQSYKGSPFVHHANLPVDRKHFDRWLVLFYETIDEHFNGEKATEAKWRADKMAQMFSSRLDYKKTNPGTLIL